MNAVQKRKFQKTVWDFYKKNKRDNLPWRKGITPYKVWISETMLQQTQVDRVVPFFKAWMKHYPTARGLARAPQSEILRLWKGLGYNSRALRAKKAAEILVTKYNGKFPKKYEDVLELPGIGPYTAGAIMSFAYNQPQVFIETNIRRVFIHHFFHDQKNIHDRDITPLIQQTLPKENLREWYFALMDYGSYLGKTIKNPNKKSRHYAKQSKFEGSDRQIRGKILEILLKTKKISLEKLNQELRSLSPDLERIEKIISALEKENFVTIQNGKVFLQN